MSVRLSSRSRHELRAYLYHVAADDPAAASREAVRVLDALERFAGSVVDGVPVTITGWPRVARRQIRMLNARVDRPLPVHGALP